MFHPSFFQHLVELGLAGEELQPASRNDHDVDAINSASSANDAGTLLCWYEYYYWQGLEVVVAVALDVTGAAAVVAAEGEV